MAYNNITSATNAVIHAAVSQVFTGNWNSVTLSLNTWQKSELTGVGSEVGILCLLRMWFTVQKNLIEGTYCNATWDNHYCWPPTRVGTTESRNCSEALRESQPQHASHLKGIAFRICQENGSWLTGNWTNYTECADSFDRYVDNATLQAQELELKEKVRYIVFIGSILSLVFLLTAIFVFCCFKSIWCDRVTIHIHLMAALTIRYVLLYIITEPFIFNRPTNYRDEDWICKTVLILYLYATLTSVNWMFIQGVYLNGKLTTNVFDKAPPFKLYYTFGWVIPAPLLAVYASVMEANHPVKCWKGYSEMTEIWIILLPISAALMVNLALLLNILRILLTKVHSARPTSDPVQFQHFRRAAKATIILSPILGINNLLFIYNPGGSYHQVYVILNSLFGSSQGVFVALVYCYLSSDVCSAIRRVYRRFHARRHATRTRMEQQRRASSYSSCLVVEQPVNRCRATFSKPNSLVLASSPTSSIINISPLSSQRNSIHILRNPQRHISNNNVGHAHSMFSSPISGFRSESRVLRNGDGSQHRYHIYNPFLSESMNGAQNGMRSMGHGESGDVLIPLSELM